MSEDKIQLANRINTQEPVEYSNVDRPVGYNSYSMETIDAIQAQMTHDQFVGWLKGNVYKYIARYHFKNGKEDLEKAQNYLGRLIRFEYGESD